MNAVLHKISGFPRRDEVENPEDWKRLTLLDGWQAFHQDRRGLCWLQNSTLHPPPPLTDFIGGLGQSVLFWLLVLSCPYFNGRIRSSLYLFSALWLATLLGTSYPFLKKNKSSLLKWFPLEDIWCAIKLPSCLVQRATVSHIRRGVCWDSEHCFPLQSLLLAAQGPIDGVSSPKMKSWGKGFSVLGRAMCYLWGGN